MHHRSQYSMQLRSQTIWNSNYAQAYALVQKLYNPETTNRSELIKCVINDEILVEVQKILEKELEKVDKKIDYFIDQAIAIKYNDKRLAPQDYKQQMIHKLKEINKTRDTFDIENAHWVDKKYKDIADIYAVVHCKKSKIKNVAKEILEEFGNLTIENNHSIKNS